ncbi:MAG TPA: hypothetical protein VGV38_07280 [Pyrinomonadaceae bacterium]|nr:hypothetical protein [Pyrinomonadaceae bacterium]
MPRYTPKIFLAFVLLLCGGASWRASAQEVAAGPEVVSGSLQELNGRRNVMLVVTRPATVDASEPGKGVIEAALNTNFRQSRRFSGTFNVLARKLNGYMKKHRSITAVEQPSNADFVVVFNLLEYRRSLGSYYPHGELYVILNRARQPETAPRIIWKSRKVMWAEDAVNELIKALKAARGEK